jgi:hypothetical protein
MFQMGAFIFIIISRNSLKQILKANKPMLSYCYSSELPSAHTLFLFLLSFPDMSIACSRLCSYSGGEALWYRGHTQ